MSEVLAERAVERLYDDMALTEDLPDDEARVLLRWAEQQIGRLARRAIDEEGFDESFRQLRRLMKRVGRFAARRQGMTPDEQLDVLGRIAEPAQALGFSLTSQRLADCLPPVPHTPADLHALLDQMPSTDVPQPPQQES